MARIPKGSLHLRVLAIAFVAFVVPLIIYFLILYTIDYRRDKQRVFDGLRELARCRAELFASADREAFRAIAVIEQLAGQDRESLTDILTAVTVGEDLVEAFYVSIENGRFIATAASDPAIVGENLTGYYDWERAIERGHISVLGLSTDEFAKFLYVTKVVESPKGPKGFLVVARDVAPLLETLLSSPGFAFPVACSILNREGLVYQSGASALDLQVIDVENPGIKLHVEPIKNVAGAYSLKWEGQDWIVIKAPIPGTDFSFLVSAERSAVFAYQTERLLHTIAIFFALFAVAGGIALYFTRKIGVPLRHLREVMDRVSQGDLTQRFEEKPMGFEINRIGLIFNETVQGLSDNMTRANAEKIQRETLQRELDIGQEIQQSILPATKPTFPGLDIGARYLPARQVGGDFYDVFVKPSNGQEVLLIVADASGKGISACLYALGIRSMFRSYTTRETSLSNIVREANNVFCEDTADSGMFVTAFCALYQPEGKQLTYSSQGHNPAYVRKPGGEIVELQGRGLALGIQKFETVVTDELALASGDLLFLYTDGVTEAHNEKLELFGEERLLAYLSRDHHGDAEQVADQLVEEVQHFCGGHPQHDDITIMVVRVL